MRSEKIDNELHIHRKKSVELEIKVKKLEIERNRAKREAKEAKQLRHAQAQEKENALIEQLRQQATQINEQMRKARAEHKVLGGVPEASIEADTRILVADTSWLITMTHHKVKELLDQLDRVRNLFLFIPSAVIEELDRIKNNKKKQLTGVVKPLITMMSKSTSRSLIVHTTLQLSTEALKRVQSLEGSTDNQILEIYYEVSKCTVRTPILLTGDASFRMKVASNQCLALDSTSIHEIICSANSYVN